MLTRESQLGRWEGHAKGAEEPWLPSGTDFFWRPCASCAEVGGDTATKANPCSDLDCLSQLPSFIVKVLSTICFIWATSEHYNTPSRVIVILREFCNQIIEMVTPLPSLVFPHHSIPLKSGYFQAPSCSQA